MFFYKVDTANILEDSFILEIWNDAQLNIAIHVSVQQTDVQYSHTAEIGETESRTMKIHKNQGNEIKRPKRIRTAAESCDTSLKVNRRDLILIAQNNQILTNLSTEKY